MGKIAFLFPGQGAQSRGMGADFYEKDKQFRHLADVAADCAGISYESAVLEENPKLHETRYTQPFLAAVEIGIARYMMRKGVVPDVAAGLSLGEYSAIAAAGAMRAEDAVGLCAERGRLMQKAVDSGETCMMAVLGLEADMAERTVETLENVYVANYNCPGQIVISGERTAVERAQEPLRAAGAKRIVPLQVSGAFHSPYMKPAAEKFAEALARVSFSKLQFPYISNCCAMPVDHEEEIAALLERQLCDSVRWEQSIRKMTEMGVDTFIEIGPGRTLSGMVRKTVSSCEMYNVSTMHEADELLSKAGRRE